MTEPERPSDTSAAELLASEHEQYQEQTPGSAALAEDLGELVPAGVCSTYRAYDPYPVHAERATGTTIHDIDGNEYLDFALNNGTQLVGHTHPALSEATKEQIDDGTLYTRPSDLIEFAAQPLIDRWEAIEQVRFTNSGTESVMHSMRLARAATGREKIIRMEGAYHGAHDPALVSKMPPLDEAGPADDPTPIRESRGIPESVPENILLAQYNDAASVERLLHAHEDEVAGILVEPACFNLGVVEPEDGFLHRLRELADEFGAVLIFDEVKTGAKIAPGGGAEYYGVQPDLVALAKAIGGGYPVGAFGGKRELMELVAADLEKGVATGAAHYGTYNGNPLSLRAVGVTLREILTDDAYDHVTELSERLADGYRDVMADAGIEGYVVTAGSQGMVYFTDERVRTFRDWEHVDEELHEAYWFGMLNRGVIPHPHDASQQWTISVQHTADDIAAHIDAFADLATHLSAAQ
ncbi:class III aminotransferase [Natrialba chahannaoensis JCM 10990]|uniref:Glutamate-1-semialdehyde 2,1-aminomutase n=1 Tax=Natrialba chahannaoensis JCM 10990 TaxID=1227492 RepID=M0AXC1_9EURY|nr:aspartate aminotransferase family protein [Natrialba chahannaoensis]ELZ02972.1 class III aminotransferase [Natrialba chahannaoensis JCM 10990]